MAESVIKKDNVAVENFLAQPVTAFSAYHFIGEYHPIDKTVNIYFACRNATQVQSTLICLNIPEKYRPNSTKQGVGYVNNTPAPEIYVSPDGKITQGISDGYNQALGIISYQL